MQVIQNSHTNNFALLDMIEYPVVVFEPNSRVIYSNSSVEQMLKGECKDCYLSQLLLCKDGSPFELTPQLLRRKQPVRCVYQKGRVKKFLDVYIKESSEGKELFYVISFVDVTAFVRREKILMEEATTDPLTAIANRRRFISLFDKELNRADRNQSEFALLLFDVDHFKKVNDTYGHAVGDLVLKEISRVVRKELRDVDVFGRLGGEEFGVVLPGANLTKAHVVADRLRQLVKAAVIKINADYVGVTISVGIIASKGKSVRDELMKQADSALYSAKHSGRDAVSSYTLLTSNLEETRVH